MNTAVFLTVGVVLVAGGTALTGALLPKTRSGAAEATIAAPRERIIGIIRDVARQPEWRAGVRSVDVRPDGSFVETTARGETISFIWVDVVGADLALSFTSSGGYRGEWTATFEDTPGQTRIVATETVYLESAVPRLMSYLFFDPAAFSQRYLADLKERAERVE